MPSLGGQHRGDQPPRGPGQGTQALLVMRGHGGDFSLGHSKPLGVGQLPCVSETLHHLRKGDDPISAPGSRVLFSAE